VREAFAHRRKSLARSLEHARQGSREPARAALEALGLPADARAEQLAPEQFTALAAALGQVRR
jgi:16S rRNA (adenine1518-N6/adenine1519-N6)-dimethyltransferase